MTKTRNSPDWAAAVYPSEDIRDHTVDHTTIYNIAALYFDRGIVCTVGQYHTIY